MYCISARFLSRGSKKQTVNREIKAAIILFAICILLTVSLSVDQVPIRLSVDDGKLVNVEPANVVWAKTYGGSEDDRALHALPADDGFLVIGSTKSVVPDATVGLAIKLNAEGDAEWNRTYLEGQGTELRYAINLTDGYMFVGNQFLASGDVNGYVVRVDTLGFPVWSVLLGGEKTDKLFSGFAVPDGFVVFGLSYSYTDSSAGWVVKLDENGAVVWSNTYGGYADFVFRSGVHAHDSDYVVAGYSEQNGNYDFCLYELNINGDVVWNQTYGGEASEKAYSITETIDGYVLVGERQSLETSTDALVVKTDPSGNMIWTRILSGPVADSPTYITSSSDGGFLVVGYTFSFGGGERDFWLSKISNNGQVEFSVTHGTEAFQEAYGVIQTDKNSYILFGWADPFGQPELIGKATYNFYIVKIEVSTWSPGISPLQMVQAIFVAAIVMATLFLLCKLWFNRKNK